MQRDKVVRFLRIAWSVWWGILCVLLVVLWVRSYWRWDRRAFSIEHRAVRLESLVGSGTLSYGRVFFDLIEPGDGLVSVAAEDAGNFDWVKGGAFNGPYFYSDELSTLTAVIPYRLPVLISAGLA